MHLKFNVLFKAWSKIDNFIGNCFSFSWWYIHRVAVGWYSVQQCVSLFPHLTSLARKSSDLCIATRHITFLLLPVNLSALQSVDVLTVMPNINFVATSLLQFFRHNCTLNQLNLWIVGTKIEEHKLLQKSPPMLLGKHEQLTLFLEHPGIYLHELRTRFER